MQQMVAGYKPRKAAYLQHQSPPSFGLEISRNGRMESSPPFCLALLLCVQETGKMHEPQKKNIQRLMILTPLCPPHRSLLRRAAGRRKSMWNV